MTNKVIVFDVDGTLANINHRRHFVAMKPKNWKAFFANMEHDTVNEDVRYILETMWEEPSNKIIICSGREIIHKPQTVRWFERNKIPYHDIYMRAEKDYRPDYQVKVELLQEIRNTYGNPYLWFDDRQQVVDAIRAQGVRVLQVDEGNF